LLHEEESPLDEGCQQIAEMGRWVIAAGLTSSRFGNISVRLEDGMLITCTGTMLDRLTPSQIVKVGWEPGPKDLQASCEAPVHRAIYQATEARAIIHTHSPCAVALSLLEPVILPEDSEGLAMLGAVPVVGGSFGSNELACEASSALRKARACVARGHGTFATGKDLKEAYTVACMTEHSSHVRYLVEMWRAAHRGLQEQE